MHLTSPARPIRMLLAVALGIWSFGFVAFFGTGLPAFDPAVRTIAQVAYGVILAAWAIWRLRGPRDPLDVAIIAGLALSLVVTLLSLDPVGSLEALGLTTGFALLFWAMRDLAAHPAARAAVSAGVAVAITLWLLIAAFTWTARKIDWIQLGGGIPNLESGPIPGWSSANTFPILIILGALFVRGMPAGLGRSLVTALFIAASVVVIPFSLGRAGYLGMLVTLLALLLMHRSSVLRDAASWFGGALPRALAAIGIGALVVAAGVWIVGGRLAVVVAGAMTSRWRLWEEAASIFAERPLAGGGPSTYHWLRLEHAPDYADRIGVYLAHNAVMQTAADGGLLLLVAFGGVLGTFGVQLWRNRLQMDRYQRSTVAVLIGFGVASLFDDMSTFPAVTAMAITLAAWSLRPPPSKVARMGLLLPAVVAVLAVMTVPAIIAIGAARAGAADARQMALAGDWGAAANGFQTAAKLHPVDAGYALGEGLALAHDGNVAGAQRAYQRALELAPGDPRSYGALALLTNDRDERIRLLDLATRRTVRDPQYAYRLGMALSDAGRSHEAAAAFALAVAIEPRLFGALPPGTDAGDVARSDLPLAFRAYDDRDPPPDRHDIDLAMSADLTDAPPAWRAVDAARAGAIPEARDLADQARGLEPHQPRPYLAMAYIAATACDVIGRVRAESLAAMLTGGSVRTNRLTEAWDSAYREEGLGDYQPPHGRTIPLLPHWPSPLVKVPPPCE